MILPPTLFLANLKQWKYRGTEFKKFYHIVLHNKEKFDKKVGRYQNMIDNWNALFESLKSLDITDSLLITCNDSDRFDSGDFKIGVCFRHCVSNYEVIRDTLAMAYIGLWQYSDGTLTDYHKWIDRGICLEKLHKDSRSCGYMALLWDDMSLLEELKRQELKREKL